MIYRDINVLTTPLLYYIGIIFFKIYGANYLAYRIYNLIIITLLYFSIYILFKKINISNIYAILYTMLIIYISEVIIYYGTNYNVLALLLTILGIILKIEKFKNNKQIKYYNLYEGILMFLIIFTKQNIGVYYILSGTIVEFLINKRKGLNNIIKQISISAILFILYGIYLFYNNSLYNFIDYTILGMSEFTTKNIAMVSRYIIMYIIFIGILIFCIFYFKNKRASIEQKILLPYSIIYLLIVYPILEKYHLMIAGLPLIILFIHIIQKEIIEGLNINKKIINIVIVLILIIMMINSMMLLRTFFRDKNCIDKTSVYYGSLYAINEKEGIERITNYIKNSKERVIILCPQAALFNIPLNIDNGILDIPTQGNVGKNGIQKIINEIKSISKEKKIKILLTKEKLFYQEYNEVRRWIQEEAELIGEIEGTQYMYNIYQI